MQIYDPTNRILRATQAGTKKYEDFNCILIQNKKD